MPKFIVPVSIYVPVHHRYTASIPVEAPSQAAAETLLVQGLNGGQIDWTRFDWDCEDQPHPREIECRGSAEFGLDGIEETVQDDGDAPAAVKFTVEDVLNSVRSEADLDAVLGDDHA